MAHHFISCESALQQHGLIPETVYTTTSVTTKRSTLFSTPLGIFAYKKVPLSKFLLGVQRVTSESGSFFLATPWRAVADIIYLTHKNWPNREALCADMRIEEDLIFTEQRHLLLELVEYYPNQRTRQILRRFLE